MPRKTSSEALVRRVRELEKELARVKQREAKSCRQAGRFKELVELLPETVYEMDLEGNLTFVNRQAFRHFGYTQEDFEKGANAFSMIDPQEWERAVGNIQKVVAGEEIGHNEYRARRKDGSTFPGKFYSTVIVEDGKPVGIRGFIIDITEQKKTEAWLRNTNEEMERQVGTRTSELRRANEASKLEVQERRQIETVLKEKERELVRKAEHLEELNAALKVLLRKREQDKMEIEEKMCFSIEERIQPYLDRLKKTRLREIQKSLIEMIELNIQKMLSPFSCRLVSKFPSLTPKEIQVASLIRQGKTSKEIADVLCISHRTVETHRRNLRSKMRLKNTNCSLVSHILSLERRVSVPGGGKISMVTGRRR